MSKIQSILIFITIYTCFQINLFSQNLQPSQLNGLLQWFKADSGVVITEGKVSEWKDLSGNNYHLVQTNSSFRPALVTNILQGKPILRFDGTDDFLEYTYNNPISNPYTIFMVVKTSTKQKHGLISHNSQTNKGIFTNDAPALFINKGLLLQYSHPIPFGYTLFDFVLNGASTQIFENTILKSTGNGGSEAMSTIKVGTLTGNSAYFLNGDIAEIVIFNRVLTINERQQIEKYLLDSYTPVVNLGSDKTITYGFCKVFLNVNSSLSNILWSTGSTSNTIEVSTSGTFSVQATDIFQRIQRDTIIINFPSVNLKDTTICAGDSVFFSPNLTGPYTYLWSDSSTDSGIFLKQEGTYFCKITDTTGCSITKYFTLTLDHFADNISFVNDTIGLCSGNKIQLNTGNEEIVSYLWLNNNSNLPYQNIFNSGIYTLKTQNQRGCVAYNSVYANVLGVAPTANFQITNFCENQLTQFTDLSYPSDSITSWSWNIAGDLYSIKNPDYIFPYSGTFPVTLTVSTVNGCANDTVINLHILKSPLADFHAFPSCSLNPSYIHDISNIPDGTTILSRLWKINENNAGNGELLIYSFPNADTYTIELQITLTNGCMNTYSESISVQNTFPVPEEFTLIQPLHNFISQAQSNINFSWNDASQAIYYKLIISGDSVFSNIVFSQDKIFENSYQCQSFPNGKYFWKVIAYNPCGLSTTSNTRIFHIFSPKDISGLTMHFAADSGVVLTEGKVSQWNDLSGNNFHLTQTTPDFQPLLAENTISNKKSIRFDGTDDFLKYDLTEEIPNPYTILMLVRTISKQKHGLISHNNLINKGIFTSDVPGIFINKGTMLQYTRNVPFNFQMYSFIFTNANTQIIENSILKANGFTGSETISSLKIGMLTGNSAYYLNGDIPEILLYNKALTYEERSFVEQYLTDKYSPPVNLGKDITVEYGFCPTTLTIGNDFYSDIFWSTGETTSSIQVNQNGVYFAEATGLGRTSSDTIIIRYPIIHVADTTICLGDTVLFRPIHNLQPYSFLWNNGSTDSIMPISTEGTYWVKITDTSGCFATKQFTVLVDSFSVTTSLGTNISICSGDFIGLETGASETMNYLWSTGEHSNTIQIINQGDYSVTATNSIGCIAKDTANISIHGIKPVAHFIADSVCFGSQTSLTDISQAAPTDNIVQWSWKYGEETFSTQQNPVFTFPLAYQNPVSLSILTADGCTDIVTDNVFVVPEPVSKFLPYKGCSLQNIQFTNFSEIPFGNLIGYSWKIYNSTSQLIGQSEETHPHLQFPESGDYTVSLTTTSFSTCSNTFQHIVEIRDNPPIDFSYSNTCAGEPTTFKDLTEVPVYEMIIERQWVFDDGTTSTLPNPVHTFTSAGEHTVKLFNRSINGCADTLSKQVYINFIPEPDFLSSNNCVNSLTQFHSISTVQNDTIIKLNWEFHDGSKSQEEEPNYTYTETGTYPIKLQAISSNGCKASIVKPINIYPIPFADFIFEPEYGIAPSDINFTNLSTGADTYLWDFGDGTSGSTLIHPSHTYASNDIYHIWLVATNQYLCSDTANGTIYIIPSEYDIVLKNMFLTEENGYYLISVHLQNLGTQIIRKLYLTLKKNNAFPITEIWQGQLNPGESTAYTFSSMIDSEWFTDYKTICATVSPVENIKDIHPENNLFCLSQGNEPEIISVIPNPAHEKAELHLLLPFDSDFSLSIVNSNGKILLTDVLQGNKGLNIISIQTIQFQNGVYNIVINAENKQLHRQFAVVH